MYAVFYLYILSIRELVYRGVIVSYWAQYSQLSTSLNNLKEVLTKFKVAIFASPLDRDKLQTLLLEIIRSLIHVGRLYEYAKSTIPNVLPRKQRNLSLSILHMLLYDIEEALSNNTFSDLVDEAHTLIRMLRDNIAGKFLYLDSEIRQHALEFILKIERLTLVVDKIEYTTIAEEISFLLHLIAQTSELKINRRILIPRLYIEALKVIISYILAIHDDIDDYSVDELIERAEKMYHISGSSKDRLTILLNDFYKLMVRSKLSVQFSDSEYEQLIELCRNMLEFFKRLIKKDELEIIDELPQSQ